ncbi:hypothetical protein BOSE125_210013 [Bosea sp. 125]|nr:hypothetical protein BOSE7B_10185 [Bosea sp. 7B]VXB99304.1 hypothetical protein BOSE29B_170013 [Bosea sp. 29B]VXC44414.1 hypothetical protein BOSE125_210013 [Bosea sp. 125]
MTGRRFGEEPFPLSIGSAKLGSSRATEGRPGTHSGTSIGKAPEWIPDLRFAPSGMT